MSEVLVHVTRGDQIESIHRGHITVADSHGTIVYHLGDPDYNICLRSCGKPLQALPVVTTGAAENRAVAGTSGWNYCETNGIFYANSTETGGDGTPANEY